jgi:hypothetical protein
MGLKQLDFHGADCGKLCGILSGSPQKIFKFFSCQLLIDFAMRGKPLFINYKCVARAVKTPHAPRELNHAELRGFPQSVVNVK